MISKDQRKSMPRAHSVGPKMICYLEEIGIERLGDLRGADPHEIALGRKHINSLAALRNLVELANEQP
ncbi:hypothetical protein ACHMW7_09305 [Aminobacter sp. UC22_36]|uniref:hypothetical protein n=1 Tax=Aminobacter sp. UC22_36 TaxID=3374549 RepID=UPI003757F2C4